MPVLSVLQVLFSFLSFTQLSLWHPSISLLKSAKIELLFTYLGDISYTVVREVFPVFCSIRPSNEESVADERGHHDEPA
jgi:hypothetical protein